MNNKRPFEAESTVEIKERNSIEYGDFRDWFILKEDRPKIKKHEVKVMIFLDSHFLYEFMTPITFSKFTLKTTMKVLKTTTFDKLIVKIPEMHILRESNIEPATTAVNAGDTANFDFTMSMLMEI